MSDRALHPTAAGQESIERVNRLVLGLGGELGAQASSLLTRHGYRLDSSGTGPHRNVLGHPLFHLPIWVADATWDLADPAILLDICESSLCGYLSVRAEDDFLDGHWNDAGAALMLSTLFRSRHQALLAPLVSDNHFWNRFAKVWQEYGEAMLIERTLHDPSAEYGSDEFDRVLRRSQPLEIPAAAVLTFADRWDLSDGLADIVRHLTKATQLFDDLIDAPDDLAAGNYTWMVRRLGGLDGSDQLKRSMIAEFDVVIAESSVELKRAAELGAAMGLDEISEWIQARRESMDQAARTMYQALFGGLGD